MIGWWKIFVRPTDRGNSAAIVLAGIGAHAQRARPVATSVLAIRDERAPAILKLIKALGPAGAHAFSALTSVWNKAPPAGIPAREWTRELAAVMTAVDPKGHLIADFLDRLELRIAKND